MTRGPQFCARMAWRSEGMMAFSQESQTKTVTCCSVLQNTNGMTFIVEVLPVFEDFEDVA